MASEDPWSSLLAERQSAYSCIASQEDAKDQTQIDRFLGGIC